MTASPRLRLSIQIPSAPDARSWIDKARRAEDHGFYSLSVPDHLGSSLPQLAPLVALAAAATATTVLRLVTTVLNNDFRHPVMLAKEAATLDVLSGGRLDLGVGCGWMESDYASGVSSWDSPGTRVRRLRESLHLLEVLLSGARTSYAGDYYKVDDYECIPVPVQAKIPLLIGGRQKGMLSLAGRRAEIVSILAGTSSEGNSREAFEQQLGWVKESASEDRLPIVGIRAHLGVLAGPGESAASVVADFANRTNIGEDAVTSSPFLLVGDHAVVRDKLHELIERYEIGYMTVNEEFGFGLGPLVSELSLTPVSATDQQIIS